MQFEQNQNTKSLSSKKSPGTCTCYTREQNENLNGDTKAFTITQTVFYMLFLFIIPGGVSQGRWRGHVLFKSVHEHVVVNTFSDKNCLYMLLEIVSGGELFAFLQTRGGSVSTRLALITACVVSVLNIFTQNICYRDLKPENLMIDAEGYIKMVDFGFAKVVTDQTYTLCGTPEYMAPEILLRRKAQ